MFLYLPLIIRVWVRFKKYMQVTFIFLSLYFMGKDYIFLAFLKRSYFQLAIIYPNTFIPYCILNM